MSTFTKQVPIGLTTRTVFLNHLEAIIDITRRSGLVTFPINRNGMVIDGLDYNLIWNMKNHATIAGIGIHCAMSGVAWIDISLHHMTNEDMLRWNTILQKYPHSGKYKSNFGDIYLPLDTVVLIEEGCNFHIYIRERVLPILTNETNRIVGVKINRGMYLGPTPMSCSSSCDSNYIPLGNSCNGIFSISNNQSLADAIVEYMCIDSTVDDAKLSRSIELNVIVNDVNLSLSGSGRNSRPIDESSFNFLMDIRRGVWIFGQFPSQVRVYRTKKGRMVVIKDDIFRDYVIWCTMKYEHLDSNPFSEDIQRMSKKISTRPELDFMPKEDKRTTCYLYDILMTGKPSRETDFIGDPNIDLLEAVKKRQLTEVKILVTRGATNIIDALRLCNTDRFPKEIVDFLFNCGTDLDEVLVRCCKEKANYPFIEYLVECGATRRLDEALIESIRRNRVDIVKLMIEKGARNFSEAIYTAYQERSMVCLTNIIKLGHGFITDDSWIELFKNIIGDEHDHNSSSEYNPGRIQSSPVIQVIHRSYN